jgi:SAM-dependent methyltransferase
MWLTADLASTAYNPISRLCYTDITSRWLMGAWVSEVRQRSHGVGAGQRMPRLQVAFDLAVLSGTCWNSLDRPRVANETLARALRRDGIAYFGCVIPPRIGCTMCSSRLTVSSPPCASSTSASQRQRISSTRTLSSSEPYPARGCRVSDRATSASWAIITLIVSRLLLSLHALDHELVIPRTRPQKPPVFAAQTFSARSQLASKGTGSQHSIQIESWEMGVCGAVEIGKIESVVGDR